MLARLPERLSREDSLELADLYALDWDSFQLAIELLREWRIDRYYAHRTDLFGQTTKRETRETHDAHERVVVETAE